VGKKTGRYAVQVGWAMCNLNAEIQNMELGKEAREGNPIPKEGYA
jgi:hypothetical protein